MTAREYDVITLKTINVNNGILPYTSLTSDGLGGTYWSTLSAPMVNGFKNISTPSSIFLADASYNIIHFYSGEGIDFIPTGPYSTSIHSYSFSELRIPGLSSLRDLSTVNFSSMGNTLFTTGFNNTLTYEIRHPTFQIGSTLLYLNDTASSFTFAGQGDILLSTLTSRYYIGIAISTFTSTGYSAILSNLSTLSTSTLSTMSSLYTYRNIYGLSSIQNALVTQSNINNQFYGTISTINTYYGSTISFYSTIFSSNASSINNQISEISTSLQSLMIQKTSTTITSYFGASSFYYKNSTFQNTLYNINNISTVIYNKLSSRVYTASTVNIQLRSTFSSMIQLVASTVTTFNAFSSLVIATTNNTFSSFSTSMTTTFSALSKTNREDYVFYPPYTVFSGVNTSIGLQYDTLLSTCSVNLSGIIPYIDSNSFVFIEYTPSYAFQTLQLSTLSTNAYQVSTFLIHDGLIINETVVTDFMCFNILNLPNTNAYQEVYSRTTRMQLNTDHILLYNNTPYTIVHFHSSIVNPNVPNLYARNPNVYGGIVVPFVASNDCYLNLYTRTLWSNSMSPAGAITIHINNGLRRA